MICYLDPKPNAYIKKRVTSCQSTDKITLPNFFIKSFPLQKHPQPSLSSSGSAVSLYFHNLQKCKICSFDNFLNLLLTIHYCFLSYINPEMSNTVFPFFLTFKSKQDLSSSFLQPSKIEEDETYYVDII